VADAANDRPGLRHRLVPRRPDNGLAVSFEDALTAEVVGAGEHLVVEPFAVGLQDHALLRPAEVGEEAGATD
jgi:hypothetical protein